MSDQAVRLMPPPDLRRSMVAAIDRESGHVDAGRAAMIDRYRSRREPGAAGLTTDGERRAYLRHRFPATHAAVAATLAMLPPDLAASIQDAIDLGAGTGASAAAILDILPAVSALSLIDSDGAALALARPILTAADTGVAVTTRRADLAAASVPAADLVTAAYLLNELPVDRADALVDAMVRSARRAVLIVEPGSRVGFKALIRARARLIDRGARLLAPCPHALACPLSERGTDLSERGNDRGERATDWCHFPVAYTDPFQQDPQPASEKISFVLAVPPEHDSRADETNAETDNARIVKAPMRRTGHVVLDLCTRDGDLVRQTVTKRDRPAYKAARAADWGDAWPARSPPPIAPAARPRSFQGRPQMTTLDPYDPGETRDPADREAALFAALAAHLGRVKKEMPAYADALDGIDPAAVTDRAALAMLPLLRKSDLPDRQRRHPPFGGLVAAPSGSLARIFSSPGPIYDPEAHRPNYWRTARALHATGLRKGDIVQNCFSYHFTPAGSMFETGAHALGCAVIPAGVGNTELQARGLNDIAPRAYVGTPDFLKSILEKADELGLDTSSLTLAHVSGGPLFPALRSFYESRGITVLQSYGTADIGLIAYETLGPDGINPGLVVDEDVIVEIVRPGTGDPVPAGEVGELVVTTLNPDYPLVRFATGDMSAVLDAPSPCGRTNMRIKGWMGRADQTTKVKGMFVHPSQVAEILRRHPDLARVRLVVTCDGGGRDLMTLKAALKPDRGADADALAQTLQSVTNLRGVVEIVALDTLPNDGKIIDDARNYGGTG